MQIVLSIIGQVVIRGVFGLRLRRGLSGSSISFVAVLGIYHMALMITAGETPTSARRSQNDRWGEWIVFSIVYGLMVGIGLAFCIIPGLFVLAFFGTGALLLPRPAHEPR